MKAAGAIGVGPAPRRSLWAWAAVYAFFALAFVPTWPDFETARRGIGIGLGGLAVVGLTRVRAEADLPVGLHATWLALVGLHLLSCVWAQNQGDAFARSLWLLGLWACATLAARTSSLRTQLAAIEWPGVVVAAFGLAQAMGLDWPIGYSLADNPVSTLGNRNVASEFTTLALVAAGLRLLRHERSQVPAIAVTLSAAYLWVNHSRAGMLAAGLTLLPLVFAPWRQHPRRRRLLLLALVSLGVIAGQWVRARTASPHQGSEPTEQTREPARAQNLATDDPPSTIAVRTELWWAGLHMVRAAPWLGVGAGQFDVHYPRFRTQREIELSTHGRAFLAAPHTAHQDPLEIAIEVGLPGFGLFVAFWILVLRRRRRAVMGLLPVVAFVVLGLVRSPLGNAPVAAFAFACVGALCREQQVRPAPGWRWRLALVGLGGLMLWVGGRETAGQCAASPYVTARSRPRSERQSLPELHALDAAAYLCPWDATLGELQARTRFELAKARHDIATVHGMLAPEGNLWHLLRLRPYSTSNLLLAAEVHQAAGEVAAASAALAQILDQDPANPDARLFLATLQTQSSNATSAVSTLYADGRPHPRLRQGLGQHLRDLATLATTDAERATLQHEADFVTAIDALLATPRANSTVEAVVRFVESAARDDLRPLILLAAASLHRDDRAAAESAAERAPKRARLTAVHAALLHDVLLPLRPLPSWSRLLATKP